jgi:hypothetical protein
MELGIDSLMTMELLALCKQDLDLVLYPREVLAHPTVAALASYIARELARVHRPAASVESSPGLVPRRASRRDGHDLPKSPWQSPGPARAAADAPQPAHGLFAVGSPVGSTLLRVMLAAILGCFAPPSSTCCRLTP